MMFEYYIAQENNYPMFFKLFIKSVYRGDQMYHIFGITRNPIHGHKKKSSKCILQSFFKEDISSFVRCSYPEHTFKRFYPNIVKHGVLSWKTITEKLDPDSIRHYRKELHGEF